MSLAVETSASVGLGKRDPYRMERASCCRSQRSRMATTVVGCCENCSVRSWPAEFVVNGDQPELCWFRTRALQHSILPVLMWSVVDPRKKCKVEEDMK